MNVATVGEFWGVLRRKYDEMGVLKGSSLLFSRDRRGEGLRRGGDDDNGGVKDWARYQRYDPKKSVLTHLAFWVFSMPLERG